MIDFAVRKTLRTFTLDAAGTFPRGVTVLAGTSGAGKSTLLRVIAGLDVPDSGRITIDGDVLTDGAKNVPAFKRDIAYVFQEYALFAHMDVLANVGYGLIARGSTREQRDIAATSWLERLGIAELAHARPSALSGGERQRVAIARALARKPRALLLDEPFAALDPTTRDSVRGELAAFIAGLDIPIVLVTHDEEDGAAFGAHIVRIERGRLTSTAEATP